MMPADESNTSNNESSEITNIKTYSQIDESKWFEKNLYLINLIISIADLIAEKSIKFFTKSHGFNQPYQKRMRLTYMKFLIIMDF